MTPRALQFLITRSGMTAPYCERRSNEARARCSRLSYFSSLRCCSGSQSARHRMGACDRRIIPSFQITRAIWRSVLILVSYGPPSTEFPIPLIHAVDPFVFNLGPDILSRDFLFLHVTGRSTGVPQLVIDLLNQPVSGPEFGAILP